MAHAKKLQLANKIKEVLQDAPIVKAMFEEYGVNPQEIHAVEIEFTPLDVSAKTKNRKILINDTFLKDGQFIDDIHYIVHELCHYLQQYTGSVDDHVSKHKDYLDKPTEIEAFQYQVQFMRDQYGEARAEEYVDSLIDFHELEGKEAKDKKRKLLGE